MNESSSAMKTRHVDHAFAVQFDAVELLQIGLAA
jgi:hypothetical protein